MKTPHGAVRLFFQVSQSERIIDMSRHSATTKDGLEMIIGYDRPLSEYFIQVYDENDELISDWSSSGNSMIKNHPPMSNSKMLSMIEQIMSDESQKLLAPQIRLLALDLPF